MKFEHLTYVPVDRELIDVRYMNAHDREMLNEYHATVCDKIMSYMETEEEREWLRDACAPI